MTSDEIRARLAALEAEAEAQARARADAAAERWAGAIPVKQASPPPEEESVPWDSLFDPPQAAAAPRTVDDDFSLEAWLAEGLRGMRHYLANQGLDEEFFGHLRNAEREVLLAWRCLIDARLRRAEERAARKPAQPPARQEIEIEFE